MEALDYFVLSAGSDISETGYDVLNAYISNLRVLSSKLFYTNLSSVIRIIVNNLVCHMLRRLCSQNCLC
jgi:hypothetical protein